MFRILIFSVLFIPVFSITASHAWLIYHKPAFKGQLFDAESGGPIKGAAVVVEYFQSYYGPGRDVFDVRETVTDENGIFYFPSYTTIMGPLSRTSFVLFTFYKPGYASDYLPGNFTSHVGIDAEEQERFFSENFGKESMIRINLNQGKPGSSEEECKVIFGVVRLPKLKTKEERWKHSMISIDNRFKYKAPVLNKLIDEENRYLRYK